MSGQKQLPRQQLDRRLKSSAVGTFRRPRGGWVRTARQTLGMRIIDLAKRMGVTEGAVRDLEKAEVSDSITIGRLKRAASALDFELVYALVPRTSIEKTFTKQILRRARRDANRTAATMDLEGQGLPTEAVENLRQEFVLEYLRDPPKDLWRD